jgi:hypothetical protein
MAKRCREPNDCNHQRTQSGRQPRRQIVILCEGVQTEPNYIAALARRMSNTAAIIPRTQHTDPEGLVREGLARLRADRGIERLFVISDCDTHANLNDAIGLASNTIIRSKRVELIISDPCFEAWLISHFEYCRAPLTPAAALAKLRQLYPEYDKADAGCMDALVDRIDVALQNADRANADVAQTAGRNPSSTMPILVRALITASR